MRCDEGEELGARALDRNDSYKSKNDPTQGVAEKLYGNTRHEPPTREDSHARCRNQRTKCLPRGVFMKSMDGEDIGKNKKKENNSCGLVGRYHLGHEKNGEKAKGAETRFGESRRDGGGKGKKPSIRGEVGHEEVRLKVIRSGSSDFQITRCRWGAEVRRRCMVIGLQPNNFMCERLVSSV